MSAADWIRGKVANAAWGIVQRSVFGPADLGINNWGPETSGTIPDPYDAVSWVYACVSRLGWDARRVPYVLTERDSGKPVGSPQDIPLWRRLNEPCEHLLGIESLAEAFVIHHCLAGSNAWALVRSAARPESGRFGEIRPLNPKAVSVRNGKVIYAENTPQAAEYDAKYVVWDHLYNPHGGRGHTALRPGTNAIESEWSAGRMIRNALRKGFLRNLILNPKHPMTPKKAEVLRQQFREKYGGTDERAGDIIVPPVGFELANYGLVQSDLDIFQGRKMHAYEICALFRVSPVLVMPEMTAYSNLKEYRSIHFQDVVAGWSLRFVRFVNQRLFAAYAPQYEVVADLNDMPEMAPFLQMKVELANMAHTAGIPIGHSIDVLRLPFDNDPDKYPWLWEAWFPFSLHPASSAVGGNWDGDPGAPPEEGPPHPPGVPSRTTSLTEPRVAIAADAHEKAAEDRRRKWLVLWKATEATERQYAMQTHGWMRRVRGALVRALTDAKAAEVIVQKKADPLDVFGAYLRDILGNDLGRYAVDLQRLIAGLTTGALRAGMTGLKLIRRESELYEDDPLVRDFIAAKPVVLGKELRESSTAMLGRQVRRVVAQGMDEGIDVVEMGARLKKAVSSSYALSPARAQVIARTETAQAAGFARYASMTQDNEVGEHEWVAAGDGLEREDHAMEDGNIVRVGEPFPVTQMNFPGDLSGPAEQRINCRCGTLPVVEA